MDYRKHFYITLFSNTSQKTYPGNLLAAFTVQLAQRIDLCSTDSWEVGLCEFSCPPPARGKVRLIDDVGITNALVYCDLITPQFVGVSTADVCGSLFTSQSIAIILLNMYIIFQSKNAPFTT
jgi:hypothetical protein